MTAPAGDGHSGTGLPIHGWNLPAGEVWVNSAAFDVLDAGITVGSIVTSDARQFPVRWNNGTPKTLPWRTAIGCDSGECDGQCDRMNWWRQLRLAAGAATYRSG